MNGTRRVATFAALAAAWVWLCGFSLFGGAPRTPVTTFAGNWPGAAVEVSDCAWHGRRIVCMVAASAGHPVPAHSLAVKVLDAHGVRVGARTFPEVELDGGERAYLVAYAGGAPGVSAGERVTLSFQSASPLYWRAQGLQGELQRRLKQLLEELGKKPQAPARSGTIGR